MAIEPTKIIFIDTEFTSLGDPWPVELISVGLSDSRGQPLFYAESDDFDPGLMADFTRAHVAPLLQRGALAMPYADLCAAFFEAIRALGEPCALASDSHWDWMWTQMMAQGQRLASPALVCDDPAIFPLWPANLSPKRVALNFEDLPMVESAAALVASGDFFAARHPHHALSDAVANALMCRAAVSESPRLNPDDPSAMCKVFKQDFAALAWDPKPAPFFGAAP